MSDNVVKFERKSVTAETELLRVWTCVCGHDLFYLLEGGKVRCGKCQLYSTDIAAYHPLDRTQQ